MVKNTDRPDYSQNQAITPNVDADVIRAGIGPEDNTLDEARAGADLENLADLETELRMQEIYLDETELDAIPTDEISDDFDTDAGIEDNTDVEPIVDNRPQERTESYGTGLQGHPNDRAGRYSRWSETHIQNKPDATLTGGDVDANYEQAEAVGDEAVGGTVPTPDQDVVDELASAVGIEIDDRSFLRTGEMLDQRDDRRWELDPKSSEDYEDRRG